MKLFGFTLPLLLLLLSCKEGKNPKPVLVVDKKLIEMDTIKFDSSYQLSFLLRNTGDADLVIDTITSSCGCSMPILQKKVLTPDDTTSVIVTYKPVEPGQFLKSLVLRSNTTPAFTVLSFKGFIEK